jgi:hypothetical protein
VTFVQLAHDALVFSKTHKHTYEDDAQRVLWLLANFRGRPSPEWPWGASPDSAPDSVISRVTEISFRSSEQTHSKTTRGKWSCAEWCTSCQTSPLAQPFSPARYSVPLRQFKLCQIRGLFARGP